MDGMIYLVMFLMLYFAPTLVAKKGRRGSIFVLNALLGWTLVFWVISLFMAVRSNETV